MEKPKIFWATNIKFLRERKKMSQERLAEELGFTRVKLNALESAATKNPSIEDLIAVATYFRLAIDTFLKVNLAKITELKLRELEAGNDVFVSGGKLRVVAITVNANNKENIEFVPIKAKAGYLVGYNDPEYITSLPKFTMPHLPENRTYRMFPTEGDSMLPIPENCLVITEYAGDWRELKDTACIVIMGTEQSFLFKMVTSREDMLLLHSLNPAYADKEVFAGDVLEIWKYHSHITDVIPSSETMMQELLRSVNEIKRDVKTLID
ncbi:XRE family transcriptional regulator [Mucilaginibacter terrae]|jgi:transcriptional regulator with XRE-family HTH domain|uniref:XRE family transcriptional regulator n=1 Tax=Mucilaginibacter terrae TaxID=1955052 RepID=UPI00363E7925